MSDVVTTLEARGTPVTVQRGVMETMNLKMIDWTRWTRMSLAASASLGAAPFLRHGEGVLQVGQQVVGVLDAARDANEIVR